MHPTIYQSKALTVAFAALLSMISGVAQSACNTHDLPTANQLHITGLIHFNVNVRDYPRSREFYRAAGFTDQIGPFPETNTIEVSNGVGIDKLYRMHAELIHLGKLPEGGIDLTVPTGRMIDIIQWKDPERLDPPYASINHMGMNYFSLKTRNLDEHLIQLTKAGATMIAGPVTEASGDSVAMVRDPDGTFVKFRQPAEKEPGNAEESVDYLSINVSDVACSKRFYEMLGFQAQGAPLGDGTESVDDPLAEALGLGSEVVRITQNMSHRVDGAKIKLNQWIKPASIGVPYPAPLTHLGLHRINWASTDVEADMALLKSRGIKFLSPIAPCCEGAASTFGFVIFEDPDGIYNQIMGTIKPTVLSEGQ